MKDYDRMTVDDFRRDVEKGRKIFQYVLINGGLPTFKNLKFEKGTYFKNCYFGRVEFDKCELNNALFDSSELNTLIFRETEANLIKFVNCKVTGLTIDSSSLINACLSNLNQPFHDGRIINAYFSNLKGASFNSSYLEESIFRCCDLSEATFKDAMMGRASLFASEIQNSDFTGAKNLTMKLFEGIDITPYKDKKYIGGISFENALKLFNLSFDSEEIKVIINWKAWSSLIEDGTILTFWLKRSLTKYHSILDQVYKLPSSEVPNEKELMLSVLKKDLRVKGIERVFE